MKNVLNEKNYLLWRLISQTRNAISKARQNELDAYGLSHPRASVLLISQITNGNVTSYKIAKWLILEPHTVSTMVNDMEKHGFLNKIAKKNGRRKSSKIVLTEKGIEAAEKASELNSIDNIMSGLSEKQYQQIYLILKILRDKAVKEIKFSGKLPFPPF